jgi:large subunit ribosomal protein L25
MTDFKLKATSREGKPNTTRKDGFIPAVVYGKDFKNENIALEKISFQKLFKEAGTSNLINLEIDGKGAFNTLVHEVQVDPINSRILHVDFFKVNMKEKIHAEIPLKFVGDSVAVIEQEGTLIIPKDSIEVECLPGDLISELEVNISGLDDFEKDIRISDLKLPAGIEVLDEAEEVVAHVEEPRSEEELAELETEVVEDVSAVELEHKGEEVSAEGEEGAEPATEEKKEEKE